MKASLPSPAITAPQVAALPVASAHPAFGASNVAADDAEFASRLSSATAQGCAEPEGESLPDDPAPHARDEKPDDLAVACSIQVAVLPAPECLRLQSEPEDQGAAIGREVALAPFSNSAEDPRVDRTAALPRSTTEAATSAEAKMALAVEQTWNEVVSVASEILTAQPSPDAASTGGDREDVRPAESIAPRDDEFQPSRAHDRVLPTAGTAAAKPAPRMVTAVEMDETAGQAEKNLPGDAFGRDFPRPGEFLRNGAAIDSRVDSRMHPVPVQLTPASMASNDVQVIGVAAPVSEPAVERVARALMDGVAHLRHVDRESVVVRITPQPGTELSLRVELRDGGVSAHLQLDRGDRQFVDTHWQELQRRMAEQGVQLHRDEESLGRSGSSFHQGFSQSQQRPEAQREEAVPFPRPPRNGSSVPRPAATLSHSRSMLERWA